MFKTGFDYLKFKKFQKRITHKIYILLFRSNIMVNYGFTKLPGDFYSEDPRQRFEEETGTRLSFPDVNERIRAYFELPHSSHNASKLESKIDPSMHDENIDGPSFGEKYDFNTLRIASGIIRAVETEGYLERAKLLRVFRNLAALGMPIQNGYKRLKTRELQNLYISMRERILHEEESLL
jgi:hypothetical protein